MATAVFQLIDAVDPEALRPAAAGDRCRQDQHGVVVKVWRAIHQARKARAAGGE